MRSEKLISILKAKVSPGTLTSKKALEMASAVALAALALLLVFKFAFFDRHITLRETEAALLDLRERTQTVNSACPDWEQVEREYSAYLGDYSVYTDNMDVLALLEQRVLPVCTVTDMSFTGRTLYLAIEGLTLDEVSTLITDLRSDERVSLVSVSSYVLEDAHGSIVTTTKMTVTFSNVYS